MEGDGDVFWDGKVGFYGSLRWWMYYDFLFLIFWVGVGLLFFSIWSKDKVRLV